jgi:hypothetical protein
MGQNGHVLPMVIFGHHFVKKQTGEEKHSIWQQYLPAGRLECTRNLFPAQDGGSGESPRQTG